MTLLRRFILAWRIRRVAREIREFVVRIDPNAANRCARQWADYQWRRK
jgi:hypothetical protein